MKNYHAILELSLDATPEQIQAQYSFLMQAWRLDNFENPVQRAKADAKAREIDEAYRVLSNPGKLADFGSAPNRHAYVLETRRLTNNVVKLALAPGLAIEMVRVPAGEFLMGGASRHKDTRSEEKPQHNVYLDEFLIGRYLVTNAQFRTFVLNNGYMTTAEKKGSGYASDRGIWRDTSGANWQHPRGPGSAITNRDHHPVVSVSWDDAMSFCQWASTVAGRRLLLPSEAQWEKAARGMDGRLYPWGDQEPDCNVANFRNSTGDTTPVGQYSPLGDSPYGAADMAGNVLEWTSSLWGKDENRPAYGYPYRVDDGREDPIRRDFRVVRGGSWGSNRVLLRCSNRLRFLPEIRSYSMGFRIIAFSV